MVALLFAPGKWQAPPLPSKEQARSTPGLRLPPPSSPFYKKLAKRLLRKLLPWPIQIVMEGVDWLYPNPKSIITPSGWTVHCHRTTQCPNTPGIRPCAQTWGPACVGTGACTCANVGQTFPGSSQDGTKKQTWIYELSPLSVCNRMIYHAYMPGCPARVWQSPHTAKPRTLPPQPKLFKWPRPDPTRVRPPRAPYRHPSKLPKERTKPKESPKYKPKPKPNPRPPYDPPKPAGKPPEWPHPLPTWIPQLIPPMQPEPPLDPLPYENIPDQPDWLPFPQDESTTRGPGPNRGITEERPPFEDFDLFGPGTSPGPGRSPAPDTGPGRRDWPNVLPRPTEKNPNPAPQPAEPPPIIRGPVTSTIPGASVRMEPPMPAVRPPRRPAARTKNPKFILAIRAGSGLGRAINIATESFDLVECLHKGLPSRLQSKPKWHKSDAPGGWTRNKGISLKTKMRDLYNAVDSKMAPLEAAKALGNALQHCIDNHLEDKQFGLIGKQMAKASRRNGAMHGLTIGGNARRAAGRISL